jgi:hypothetical protein
MLPFASCFCSEVWWRDTLARVVHAILSCGTSFFFVDASLIEFGNGFTSSLTTNQCCPLHRPGRAQAGLLHPGKEKWSGWARYLYDHKYTAAPARYFTNGAPGANADADADADSDADADANADAEASANDVANAAAAVASADVTPVLRVDHFVFNEAAVVQGERATLFLF